MTRYADIGGGRRSTFLSSSEPGLQHTTTTPDDGVGLDGEFTINTSDWTLWGPKGSITPGSWAGTKTSLKNFRTPKTWWNFGIAQNAGNMVPVLNDPANDYKTGDYFLFGPTPAQVSSGFNYSYFWVNTDRKQNPPSFLGIVDVGNWYCLLASTSGGSSGGGDIGSGSGDGGDGGGE